MGLALTATLALCLWVAMWAVGIKGFDGILLTMLIVVVGVTLKSLGRFLPGAERS
jgi:hypothetical protein